MTNSEAVAKFHARLAPPTPTDQLVCVDVGPAGEALALWSTADQGKARVTIQRADTAAVIEIAAPTLVYPTVQLLPYDRLLIVGTRGLEQNAVVLSSRGAEMYSGTLGDGIAHVQTTPAGNVWVGYFDEGVFGDDNIGAPGIVRFDERLHPTWRFPSTTPYGPIDDCYALNVDGDTAWACYYSDFPIVRIHNGDVRGWRNNVSGASALITDGNALALVGGYQNDKSRVVVGRLSDNEFEPTATPQLVLNNGAEASRTNHIGRGAQLHVFNGADWYKLDLADLT